MSELKFRVFDDVNFGTPQIRHFNIYQAHFINHIEKLEIMQYTGLKDKNGKEIYEGDIVESTVNVGVVEWNEEKATFVVKWYESFTHPLRQHKGVVKIIGNIHENPSLMEGVPCE